METLVSICCMAYNHEKFIRQCLDGFVMQKTTFAFEILVHEDASTDNTASIVSEYESKFPHLFRCVYQTENQFKKQNTLVNILFKMAKGKYIALCEGDDYWTDPLKLQKQVDFLEANEDYTICFHDVYALYPDGKMVEDSFIEKRYLKIENKDNITYKDFLEHGNFINTCSTVFRNQNIEFSDYFSITPVGDYLLHIHNSRNGKVKKVENRMAVYRRGVGIYSTLNELEMLKKRLQAYIILFSCLEKHEDKRIIFEKICKINEYQINFKHKLLSDYTYKELLLELLKKLKRKLKF